ncbi:MAG TPA: hypothetical protein ENI99_10670 [Sedimenticola sp.]|nr:hypothetical protein [Sedimenticola sp.]
MPLERSGAARKAFFLGRLAFITLLCWQSQQTYAEAPENSGASAPVCAKELKSHCNATQEQMLRELLRELKIFSTPGYLSPFKGEGGIIGDAPALELLPKDRFGMVNWTKAVTDGLIRPRDNLAGEPEEPYEGFYDNIILFQANVFLMADVAFPHGMHTYWISCDSCHPEPFKKKIGSTTGMNMKGIEQGKWCGKCHGKVSFPASTYMNCRRCHSITKESLSKEPY